MKTIEQLYTKKTSFYHHFFIDALGYGKGLEKFFENYSYLKENIKILDAGCGTGIIIRILTEIAKKKKLDGIKYYGFDLTQAMLDLFKKWISKGNDKNITFKKADVLLLDEQLPKDWQNYDLIVSSAMLEYIPKDKIRQAIRNLGSLLKKDGTILIFITKRNLIMRLLIKMWWKANMYEKDEIKQVLIDSGFRKIIFKNFLFPYWHLNHWGFIIEAKK
ncbi:TPA: class I SAM-dependent methyltransferase [Candidatus Woesearchaeota archaeon]|nr:class I SAM-dependent methyltransferase [Candidatus Woesearchaeota archaeon]